MKPAAIVSLVVLSSAASAGITWMALKDQSPASTEAAPQETKTREVTVVADSSAAAPSTDSAWTGDANTTVKASRKESERPNGISEEAWERASGQANMMQMWAKRMEDGGGRMQRWMNRNLDRDTERIANHLGLDEGGSDRINGLLNARMEKATQKSRDIFSRLTADNDVLTELIALREMGEKDALNAPLTARQDELRRKVLGEYYPEDGEIDDRGIMAMMRPEMPAKWYKDEELLTEIAGDMDDDGFDRLSEYATRLEYLDRESDAYRESTRIERRIPLQDGQSDQLFQIYLENSEPSREQLGKVLSQEQLDLLGK